MEIARECSLESWSEIAYREEIGSADGLVLVAERPDGNIVGFFVGRIVPGPDKDNADAEIYNVGVSESWRGSRRGDFAGPISRPMSCEEHGRRLAGSQSVELRRVVLLRSRGI